VWGARGRSVRNEWSGRPRSESVFALRGCLPPIATAAAPPESGFFTAKMAAGQHSRRQDFFYRVRFREPVAHRRFPKASRRPAAPAPRGPTGAIVSFVWGRVMSAGQLGATITHGGMFNLRHHAPHQPDFLLHSRDTIYPDCIIASELSWPTQGLRTSLCPEKAKFAETLDEFRAAHKYNFLSSPPRHNVRPLHAEVPDLVPVGRSTKFHHHQLVGVESSCRAYKGTRHQLACAPLRARSTDGIRWREESIVPEPGRVYRTL